MPPWSPRAPGTTLRQSITHCHRPRWRLARESHPAMPLCGRLPSCSASRSVRHKGIEPSLPPWEGGVLAFGPVSRGRRSRDRTCGFLVPNQACFRCTIRRRTGRVVGVGRPSPPWVEESRVELDNPHPTAQSVGVAGIAPAASGPPDQRAPAAPHPGAKPGSRTLNLPLTKRLLC